jgi:hypothetical protein
MRSETDFAISISRQSIRVLFTFSEGRLICLEFELMINPRKVIIWVGVVIDFSLCIVKPKEVRRSIAI